MASMAALVHAVLRPRDYPLILTQMYAIGVQSAPVVMTTGAFVGMILAIQAYGQLASMGFKNGWRADQYRCRQGVGTGACGCHAGRTGRRGVDG